MVGFLTEGLSPLLRRSIDRDLLSLVSKLKDGSDYGSALDKRWARVYRRIGLFSIAAAL